MESWTEIWNDSWKEINYELSSEGSDYEEKDEEVWVNDELQGVGHWNILDLKNIPYIGEYGEYYKLLRIKSCRKWADYNDWSHDLPTLAHNAIVKLIQEQNFEINKEEYLSVWYSASFCRGVHFYNNNSRWARYNLIFHPYLMENMSTNSNEEK